MNYNIHTAFYISQKLYNTRNPCLTLDLKNKTLGTTKLAKKDFHERSR